MCEVSEHVVPAISAKCLIEGLGGFAILHATVRSRETRGLNLMLHYFLFLGELPNGWRGKGKGEGGRANR